MFNIKFTLTKKFKYIRLVIKITKCEYELVFIS